MTLDEALEWGGDPRSGDVICTLAAEVRRLQAEVERLPARRAKPTVKSQQIAPTHWPAWGMIDETDEEFAARAGRKVAEVVP